MLFSHRIQFTMDPKLEYIYSKYIIRYTLYSIIYAVYTLGRWRARKIFLLAGRLRHYFFSSKRTNIKIKRTRSVLNAFQNPNNNAL